MDQPETQHIDKGKGRAHLPTERTPLLGSTSTILDDPVADPRRRRQRLHSKLTTVFLVSLSICILGFISAGLLAWSYASRASNMSLEKILVFAGPDHVEVRNITSDGVVWVNVKGRIGVDVGNEGVLWNWMVRKLDKVAVELSTVRISGHSELVRMDIPGFELPLSVDPPKGKTWLKELEREVRVQVTGDRTVLEDFVRETWRRGVLSVRADVDEVDVSWRKFLKRKLKKISTDIQVKVPLTGPFPSFANIAFNVTSSPLAIAASATIANPAPAGLSLSVPSLPFIVSTTDKLRLASVTTAPIALTYPNISVHISGSILPIPATAFPSLSLLVSRYLAGQPNTFLVSTPLLPQLDDIEVDFPAPNPRPQVLRDVTIRNMKIHPSGSKFLASGIVEGKIVLPKGINVDLDVSSVFPDVLVFDGEVGAYVAESHVPTTMVHKPYRVLPPPPPESPLPSPLPSNAFARVRPDEWLPSLSVRIEPPEDDNAGATYLISAQVVDVPLEVLPGRQKEFSNFVGKVIFSSSGATAGIQGTAAVVVAVDGLPIHGPGEVMLQGLPFHGTVHVGKKSL